MPVTDRGSVGAAGFGGCFFDEFDHGVFSLVNNVSGSDARFEGMCQRGEAPKAWRLLMAVLA